MPDEKQFAQQAILLLRRIQVQGDESYTYVGVVEWLRGFMVERDAIEPSALADATKALQP